MVLGNWTLQRYQLINFTARKQLIIMRTVIENLATFPRLIFGTATSFFGAIVGKTSEVQSVPPLQYIVWGASIFAAIATGVLALTRAYIEIKKACREK